jgi:hypothetical protein
MERIAAKYGLDGIKRFQLPGTIITVKCPKCGEWLDIELVDQIYYPAEGNNSVSFECENCNHDVERKIDIVSVVVTLDVHDSEII